MKTHGVPWVSDVVYAGGGKRHPNLRTYGWIFVADDGSLSVLPDDDYYSGKIEPHEARELALAILERTDKK